ncbi:lytic murein transglycosylase [Actinopolymorpha sp. B17G11]|uniref:lytic transglycosylase domain-containing protein n=1 Tax=Actinopolymorpha sp. B17G11 TaxID=3160861 RepID=UPI0032E45E25
MRWPNFLGQISARAVEIRDRLRGQASLFVVLAMVATPVVAGFVTNLRGASPPHGGLPGHAGHHQRGEDRLDASPVRMWAVYAGQRAGIPVRALEAYATAEARVGADDPGCRLHWSTLAGIGSVESHHGHIGGRLLRADGRPSIPIFGIALNGRPDIRAIRDTDGGRLDGDPVWDRAVGPMQFIPDTWAIAGTDGDGNGRKDPHDLDDAAMAAARYLCAAGGDLSSESGWRRAILSYNHSSAYLRDVRARASQYASASAFGPTSDSGGRGRT